MNPLTHDSPSVQSYLSILQSVIGRMAANSASSKTWCITIVSALLVVVADKSKPDLAWIALIPILLFLFLDSYYLGLERGFRESYNTFIKKLHAGEAVIEDTFIVSPEVGVGHVLWLVAKAQLSLSVWPFYGVLGGMVWGARVWVL